MTARDDAIKALNDRDWSGATIDTAQPRDITMVVSARLHADVAEELFAEAEARGMKPSVLAKELIEQGLAAARAASAGEVMVVDPSVLRTGIEQVIRRAQRPGLAA